jgi:hypothetical protein
MVRACSEFQLPGHVRVTVAPEPVMERAAQELIAAWRAEARAAETEEVAPN